MLYVGLCYRKELSPRSPHLLFNTDLLGIIISISVDEETKAKSIKCTQCHSY